MPETPPQIPTTPTTTDKTPAWTPEIEGDWKNRLREAKTLQGDYHKWWDAALDNYTPKVTEDPESYSLQIRTNRTYTLVERKRAEMFFQRPDLQVSPSPLLESVEGGDQIAATHADILNEALGVDGVHVKGVARHAVFDYLMFGAGWTKLGYRAHTQEVEQQTGQEPVTDEVTGEIAVDPMTGEAQMRPVMGKVPVIIKGEVFWEAVPVKTMLLPTDQRSIDFDLTAPWMAMTFEMPLRQATRLYGKEAFKGFRGGQASTDTDEAQRFDHGTDTPMSSTKTVKGTEIWYRSSLYRDDVVHPDHLTELVLIEGIEKPVRHRDSPYQSFTPKGTLTPDSMLGFPFHPLVIRPLSDSPYIMSDVAVALPLTKELDKFRDQMVKQRDINQLKYEYDTSKVGKNEMDKLVGAPQGGAIGVPTEAFTQGWIRPIPSGPYPRENFEYNDYIDKDLAQTHAIDATGAGTTDQSGVTATEANLRQQNVNIRLGAEQGFVADWLVRGATKFSSLQQRFLEPEDVLAVVGEERAAVWDQWRRTVPARLAFAMLPDSSLKNDTPLERKQLMDFYTYVANDPSVNRQHLNTALALKHHLDPTKAFMPPDQVPQPKPDPPGVSYSFSGEDLSPLSPQMPVVMEIMKQGGVEIPPEVLQQATALAALLQTGMAGPQGDQPAKGSENGQPPHGGKLAQAESLDKHQQQQTGGMQGSGALSPGLAGGGPTV